MWHCVTGYLEPGASPRSQILIELREELGLLPEHIHSLRRGLVLQLVKEGCLWIIHTFEVSTPSKAFQLNWENDRFAWVTPENAPAECVEWLADVIASIDYRRLRRVDRRPAAGMGG